jgi:hypothetical protein
MKKQLSPSPAAHYLPADICADGFEGYKARDSYHGTNNGNGNDHQNDN